MWVDVIVLAAAGLAVWVLWAALRISSGRRALADAFSRIELQLKRRHGLIPKIIETVAEYAPDERETFDIAAQLAGNAAGAHIPTYREKVENQLSYALDRVMQLCTRYVALKSDVGFRHYYRTLFEIEEAQQEARALHAAAAIAFNKRIARFPGRLIAGVRRLTEVDPFEIQSMEERRVPLIVLGGEKRTPRPLPE